MGRLPHRIYKGLRAASNGLPRFKTMQQVLDDTANRRGGPSWEDRARVEASKIFSELKKQGFTVERGDGIFLTKRGREKLKALAKRFLKIVPRKQYIKEKSKDLVIVSFDIPERDRHKRNWLRSVLKNLDLKLYHESLWMGNIVIPEDFIKDIAMQQLNTHVAIFTVGKQGTLRKLI